MRALAISDTHFGAWTGDDLLSHAFARERLASHLDDIDELILLGDLFDFLFSTVEHAVEQAQGFFDLVGEHMRGRRVVFLAGNHDHHTMVRELEESMRLRIADGIDAQQAGRQAREDDWLRRYLERRPQLTLRQVDPLIRELVQYRDLINTKIEEQSHESD